MSARELPTPAQLAELFWYDALSGQLIRRIDGGRWGREKAEAVVGTSHGEGYLVVTVFGQKLLVHRVAFAIANGAWPDGHLDHIDGDRANNRLSNLRVASPGENNQNQRHARSDSGSGLLGVRRMRTRWQAVIKVDGSRKHLGTFDTPEEAHAAYVAAKRDLHPYSTL